MKGALLVVGLVLGAGVLGWLYWKQKSRRKQRVKVRARNNNPHKGDH
tara:strand:+ start:303 stop:443 length:141 start_codon:yes stop_codon:yes gene_type:complete